MTTADIVKYRLVNQQIANPSFTQLAEIIGWLGAMQAQEFALAKWAIGLRVPGLTDADVENAFNEGKILRTHLLRPTWHFVTPADIGWLLRLSAPRVNSFNSSLYRKLELDNTIFNRCNSIFEKALEGKHLNRAALKHILEQKKINTDGLRFVCLLMHAELDGIICSGPRIGNQFTYALLEERAAPAKKLSGEEALSELSKRYFTSRGPATLYDFVWWSGLTVKQARLGITSLPNNFVHEQLNGVEYIFLPPAGLPKKKMQTTFLMPDYDEYGISYRNREAIFSGLNGAKEELNENEVFNHIIIIDGVAGGTWQKIKTKSGTEVQTYPYKTLPKTKLKELQKAEQKYLAFVNGF